MSFQIVKAEDRLASMIDWFTGMCRSITDFTIGSKIRTKLETVAVEMESQDYAFYVALKKAIPVSIYQAFNFTLNPATKASGKVTFTANVAPTSDIIIPAKTRVATVATTTVAEQIYELASAVTLLAGQTTVQASIIATYAGISGNTLANTITVMKTPISGINSVNNTVDISNGTDRETEDARRARFVEYINTLSRGTGRAIEYGAKTAKTYDSDGNITERVVAAKVMEPYLDNPELATGNIYCYIYNGTGSTSGELINTAQKTVDGYVATDGTIVPGYKAAGVVCTVLGAVEVPTNITMDVTASTGKTTLEKSLISANIVTALAAYISTFGMGDTLLKSKIIDIAMGIDGVYNVAVTAPANDVTVTGERIIVSGTITPTVA